MIFHNIWFKAQKNKKAGSHYLPDNESCRPQKTACKFAYNCVTLLYSFLFKRVNIGGHNINYSVLLNAGNSQLIKRTHQIAVL
ncbi:hypothetical protein SAMN03159284_03801 [Mucilaginibacter sp. NFR10]|nr:hypothetical protein SAMN03159284_03801 [Mucilaginibacter sp. NFR10]